MRFSLKTLLGWLTAAALTFFGLTFPSRFLADCFVSAVVCLVAVIAVAAAYGAKERRPFWVGFLIFAVGYSWHELHTYTFLSRQETYFMTIGHSAFAIAFGCLGGWFASWLAKRSEEQSPSSTDPALTETS